MLSICNIANCQGVRYAFFYKKRIKKQLVLEKFISLRRFFEREIVLIGEIRP